MAKSTHDKWMEEQLWKMGYTINGTKVSAVAAREKEYWEKQARGERVYQDDIGPVAKRGVNDIGPFDFFQKSAAFEDGFDMLDIPKTILGTAGDVGLELVKGVGGLVEGVTDLAGYGMAAAADFFGAEEQAKMFRQGAQTNRIEQLTGGLDRKAEKYSILGDTTDSVAQGIGQVGSIILTGGMGAAGGLGSAGVSMLTTGMMGASGMGSGMSQAYSEGASDKEALAYGAMSGTADAVSELLFGGLGKAINAVGFNKGVLPLDDLAAKALSKLFKGQMGKNITEFIVKAGFEGAEEVIAGTAQAFAKHLTYKSEEDIMDILKDEKLFEQFVVGALTSGISQTSSLHIANQTGTDYVTGNTGNEQAVIDREIQKRIGDRTKDGGKLSNAEKTDIHRQVMRDLERGNISIETIEEVLGKDSLSRYEALSKEADEFKTLYETESGKLSAKQQDRLAELKARNQEKAYEQRLMETRAEISKQVEGLARMDRLGESYNERVRRGEAFRADLSKYTGKYAQQTVKTLMEQGIATNGNDTHDMVETAVRIAEDTQSIVRFTTNDILRDSGQYNYTKQLTGDGSTTTFELGKTKLDEEYTPIVTVNGEEVSDFDVDYEKGTITFASAPEGEISVEYRKIGGINGYYDKATGEITINLDSPRYWNYTVGHEITHKLEKAGSYDALAKAAIDYAKSNGQYEARMAQIQEDYAEGTDFESELVADLVGDYIFSDYNFVSNLAANHQNVFQKVFAEIKHLAKLVTAGSREARKLEIARRNFEKAYREIAKAQKNTAEGGVQYSIAKTSKMPYGSQLVQIEQGKINGSNSLYVGTPSSQLQAAGLSDAPLAMNQSDYRKSRRKAGNNKNYSAHNVPYEFFKNMPQHMADAPMMIDNGQKVSVITSYAMPDTKGNASYVIAGVWQNQKMESDTVNLVKSVYPLDDIAQRISKAAEDGKLVVANKNKAEQMLATIGIQPSEVSRIINLARETLAQQEPEVKTQYSLNQQETQETNKKLGVVSELVDGKKGRSDSLSDPDAEHPFYGNFGVPARDLRYNPASQEDIGPVAENAVRSESSSTVGDIGPVVGKPAGNQRTEKLKAALDERYRQRRAGIEADVVDKDGFISRRAGELYREIRGLTKGVKASDSLGYLLDHGYEWGDIRAALVNVQHTPGSTVNQDSAVESVVRKMLNEEYEGRSHDLADLEAEYREELQKIESGDGSTVQEKVLQKIVNTQTELDTNRQMKDQSLADFNEKIASLQAKYDALKNKTTIKAQNIQRRIARLTRLRDNMDADYAKRISDLEKRVEKYHSEEYSRAEYRREKQKGYTQMWKELVGNTSTWKDMKLGLSYKTKTLRRILRKVVTGADGKADITRADAIYDEMETKYDHNEALLKTESRRIKEIFHKLNLNHEEDTYAHMLGEFRHNPDTTLTEEVVREYYEKHKGRINTAKVDTAITEARKVFDELLVQVNQVLREQGMKEIPYREGYFPHFTKPKQGPLAKLLNWRTIDTEIPTSIAGLTQDFKPGRSWQSFAQTRRGDTTDYSLYQGLDTYIHGALDWIYHIEDIQKRRALENYLRYIHSDEGIQKRIREIQAGDYDAETAQSMIDAVLDEAKNPLSGLVRELRNRTNTLANKKSSLDREMEDLINRKVYSTMTNLNNRVNANLVVGSFSAAITNFIPMVQSWHEVSPGYTVMGLADLVRSAVKDDGIVAKSDFLTNRLMEEENLYKTGWDKVIDKLGIMMDVVDGITSQTVWRSKYLQNLHEGMSENEAIRNADQFAKNLMAGRSRGNAPSIFDSKNPLIKIFTAFQLEVANQYGYMFDDVAKDSPNKVRLVKGYATAFLGAYLYNNLFSLLTGRDAATDPIGIIADFLRDLFDDEDEEEPLDNLMDLGKDILEEVPFIGGLLGGGRIPLASAFPYANQSSPFQRMMDDLESGDTKSLANELLKPLYYLVLPAGGGQLKKTIEGLSMFSDEHPVSGSYTAGGSLRFPVEDTLANRVQAGLFGQYASQNAREYFDNDYAPLNEKQTREYMDLDIPIADYWKIREGMKGLDTIAEKGDYIGNLDLPVLKQNILINNASGRKEHINMTDYHLYDDFEEFDFAVHNPEKYEVARAIGYDRYRSLMEQMSDMNLGEKARYMMRIGMSTEEANLIINSESSRKEPIDLTGYDGSISFEEWENPAGYALGVAVGGYEAYKQYSSELNAIAADKDKWGKSISGSRKAKVQEYIRNMDVDDMTKLILYKLEYTSYDSQNREIIEYINSLEDLSFEQKIAVLRKMDFYVDDEGNVWWK